MKRKFIWAVSLLAACLLLIAGWFNPVLGEDIIIGTFILALALCGIVAVSDYLEERTIIRKIR